MKKRMIMLIIAILIIAGLIYYFESLKTNSSINTSEDLRTTSSLNEGKYTKAPELTGISGYINTEENLKISDQKGKVVLVDFWTYTCINCIRTLPHLIEWDKKYQDRGLVIIGVHTPEFSFEKEYENVKDAVEKHGIEYAVVQDNDYKTWRAYKNRYWPHKYLIDSEGFIRYDHIGEGAYEETEMKIQELLSEIGEDVNEMEISTLEDQTPKTQLTPELYAGYNFALPRLQNIGNKEGLQPDKIVSYTLSNEIKKDTIYLEGSWKSNEDNLQATEEESSIVLDFTAGNVNIVANTLSEPLELEVFINDEYLKEEQAGTDVKFEGGKAFILINKPQLYNVIKGVYGNYKLTLKTQKDFTFNAFTFG